MENFYEKNKLRIIDNFCMKIEDEEMRAGALSIFK